MAVSAAQMQKYLKGIDYPISKNNLVKHAKKNGADQTILDALKDLPQDEFDSPTDVSKAFHEETVAKRH